MSRLVLLLSLTACATEPRFELRTGSATAGVELHDVSFAVPFALRATTTDKEVASGLTMKLRATVLPPMIDGQRLQATDVQWYGNKVVAAYNFSGTVDMGAIQLIDASDPANPTLLVEAVYPHTDLNRVALQGSRVVVAGADQELGATLEHFKLHGDHELDYDDFTQLPSYATTYVEIDGGGRASVTYGNDGGAARYDLNTEPLAALGTASIPDARWIGSDGNDLLVVAGSPARIERHTNHLGGAVISQPIAGGTIGAPTWALVNSNVLYVAADQGGVLLFDARTLAPLSSVPLGGDTNGVALTSDRRILFVAGGEAGLVAVDVGNKHQPQILRSIDVPDNGSANAIVIHGKSLALADGLGGVKLLTFERTAGSDYDLYDHDGDTNLDIADLDDDADGVLDIDDHAPLDPDAICNTTNELVADAGAIAEVFTLGCDHPDVGGSARPRLAGTLPTDHDWYAPERRVRTLASTTSLTLPHHNIAPGSCGEAYVATRWKTTAHAAAGDHTLRLATTDDGWLFVDGKLVLDLGGAHDLLAGEATVTLTAGAHAIEVYSVRRRAIVPQTTLSIVGGGPDLALGQRTCLASSADDDADGLANLHDVAPLHPAAR